MNQKRDQRWDPDQEQNQKQDQDQRHKIGIIWGQRAAAITAAVFVWQIAAVLLDQTILLASPVDVLKVLLKLVVTVDFWVTVLFSMGRIMYGFALAMFAGMLLAFFSAKCRTVKLMLWPYLSVMKATPVASVIILLLVWFSSRNISILVSLFMVFPVVYTNILTGIEHLDPKMEEMADVFEIRGLDRFLYIHLGQMRPYLTACVEIGVAMAVKSGIAAEVIGIPAGSIGRQLYDAKIYLATPELFAWTFALIVCSVILEHLSKRLVCFVFTGIERRLS